jgi:predicted nucleic acid-binding protein
MYTRPYLDTSVYLAYVKGSPPEPAGRAELATQILEDAQAGRYQLFASTFIKVEVIRDKGQPAPLGTSQTGKIDDLFKRSYFVWVDLDLLVAEKARDLARMHGFRPADAVHLATAIRAGCDELLVWDKNFRKGVFEGVTVAEPHWEGQGKLDLAAPGKASREGEGSGETET